MTESQAHYLLIFSGITAFGVLLGAIGFSILSFSFARLLRQVATLASEAQGKVYPILENVQDISEKVADISDVVRETTAETAPKLRRMVRNLEETSEMYHARLTEVNALVADTTRKAKKQTERVDTFVTDSLDRTHEVVTGTISRVQHIMDSIHNAVYAPVRQISGLASGAKAGLESLIANFAPKHETKTPKPVAFEGESVYTGYEDDYHA
jgi:methyl-accepting chemotaxis protein